MNSLSLPYEVTQNTYSLCFTYGVSILAHKFSDPLLKNASPSVSLAAINLALSIFNDMQVIEIFHNVLEFEIRLA